MNVVKDLNSLVGLLHTERGEVIVFPVGAEGQMALDFFRYSNLMHRVCCIAAPAVPDGTTQQFVHEVPVIPFENLVHFRESEILIVVAPEQFHSHLNSELTRLGFKFAFFVHSELNAQIKNELNVMQSSGRVLMWYMQHFDRKLTELSYQITEQNSISDLNTKAFAEYKHAFHDKDIVIVGGGPTVNYYRPIPNAIHIGLNYAWKNENIPLDFLFTGDAHINNADRHVEDGFSKVRERIFITQSHCGLDIYLNICPEDWCLKSDRVARYHTTLESFGQFIHQDITCHSVMDFCSISFSAIQFALFTYPKRLYLVGLDTSTAGHFYPETGAVLKKAVGDQNITMRILKVGYARTKMFAKRYYPETEIISINPVGLRGLFKDVYTEEYKASLVEQEN